MRSFQALAEVLFLKKENFFPHQFEDELGIMDKK